MPPSAYLPLAADITAPCALATAFKEGDPTAHYWGRHGEVYFGDTLVKGAEASTLRCWMSGYAADARHVYLNGRLDRTLDASTFRCHSMAFHGDDSSIRTPFGGRIKDADVASFEALDAGYEPIGGGPVPFLLLHTGYARDRARVYWCDSGGKGMHVTKADPLTFQALFFNFGLDARHVFWGRAALPKARPADWRRVGGHYSTDGQRVYHTHVIVPDADPATFQAYPTVTGSFRYGRDKFRCYDGEQVVEVAAFENGLS